MFADRLEALLRVVDREPWTIKMIAEYEPGEPNVYGIYGGDTSIEATICELWSGEHDNPSTAELICFLRNHAPALLALVKAAQIVEKTFRGNDSPAFAELRQALRALDDENT